MDELSEAKEDKEKKLPPWLKKDGEKDDDKSEADDKEKVEESTKYAVYKLDGKHYVYPDNKTNDGTKGAKKVAGTSGSNRDKVVAKAKELDSKKKVEESVVIQADGEEAASLLNILKLSGQKPLDAVDATPPMGQEAIPPSAPGEQDDMEFSVDEADRDPAYANTPDEETCGMDAAIPAGDDLNRPKTMYKHSYRQGDNPMAMEDVAKMEGKLKKMFESMSKVDSKKKSKLDDDNDEWYDKNGRPSRNGAYDAGGHYYAERDADKE